MPTFMLPGGPSDCFSLYTGWPSMLVCDSLGAPAVSEARDVEEGRVEVGSSLGVCGRMVVNVVRDSLLKTKGGS